MTKELLNAVLSQLITASGLISLILLAWQGGLIAKDNKKHLKLPFKWKRLKFKKARIDSLFRLALGFLIVSSAYILTSLILEMNVSFSSQAGIIEYYFSTLEVSESASSFWAILFGNDFGFTGILGAAGFIVSGLLVILSSAWKQIRYIGDSLFWLTILYVGGRTVQLAFFAEANGFQFLSDASYQWLGLYGFFFFVLVFVFSVKGLIAFDHKKMRPVKERLEQILQLCIGLVLLITAQGIMNTLSLTYASPESFRSFMLDSDFAVFRYSAILYLFGGGIFLRQIFPYFRWLLMGLLSLTAAYLIFDVVNVIV